MRPCDDTFGLVRGNRRKAVFAFKGLFSEGRPSRFRFWQWVLPRISEVRGKSKLAEHTPIFVNKTAGRESLKPGLGLQISVYPALPQSPAGSMRQILEPPSTTAFPHKGSAGRSIAAFRSARHARDLPHTSEFWPCTLCSTYCKHLIDAI